MSKTNIFLGFSAGCLFLLSSSAFAATRTAHFTQSGRNVTQNGLGETAQSNCRLNLVNPSSVSQDFSIAFRVQVTGNHANTAPALNSTYSKYSSGSAASCGTATNSTSGTTSSGTSSVTITCTGTLAATVGVNYVFDYPVYATKASGTTSGVQTVSCSGTVTVSDPSSSTPGFVLGTGNLTIFTETGEMETDSVTGGQVNFGGQAVYSQVPIVINRSKPF